MGAPITAHRARRPDGSAAGMGLAMLVISVLSLVFLSITLVMVVIVRSQEWLPRAVHWMGRKLRRRWAL